MDYTITLKSRKSDLQGSVKDTYFNFRTRNESVLEMIYRIEGIIGTELQPQDEIIIKKKMSLKDYIEKIVTVFTTILFSFKNPPSLKENKRFT